MNDDNGRDNGRDNGHDSGRDSSRERSDGFDAGTEPLDALARLRAADPAADVEPRAGFADAVLAQTVGAPSSADAASGSAAASDPALATAAAAAAAQGTVGAGAEPASVHDLSAERARRRPLWLSVAAVAASIAIVGGAGYGIGSSNGGTSTLADGAAPPISLPSGPGGVAPETGGAQTEMQGGMSGGTDAQLKMSAGSMTGSSYPFGFGRNSFTSSGLSTEAGTAAAYTFDARAASNAERVAAVAAALGVEGEVELRDGAWIVGPQDGTAPSLSVSLDGTLSFSFVDPNIDPWRECAVLESTEPCQPPADVPSADAGTEALRGLIAAFGRDPGAFEFSSESWEGAFTRSVQAWPIVDGRRIDQSWSLELTADGIYGASGALAEIVPLGDYELASEQQAFERLSDPRFSAQMTVMPFAAREQSAQYNEWVPPTEPPATPGAGTMISWPVGAVEIVDARLGLASQWQPDGSVLVVPAYEFTDADGGVWSVIAVADSLLDFSADTE